MQARLHSVLTPLLHRVSTTKVQIQVEGHTQQQQITKVMIRIGAYHEGVVQKDASAYKLENMYTERTGDWILLAGVLSNILEGSLLVQEFVAYCRHINFQPFPELKKRRWQFTMFHYRVTGR